MGMKTPLLIENTVKAEPVGSCIYCGSRDKLTDEHIVPFALGGRYVLPSSSCEKCAKITSSFEQKVLRGFMLNARTASNMPTRRRKERPKTLTLEFEKEGKREIIGLLPNEHPGLLHLPILEEPGFLTGYKLKEGMTVKGLETIQFGKNPYLVAHKLNASSIISTTDVDIWAFARLLAKIGYCMAVSSIGLIPREKVPVLPFIMGESKNAPMWIGSSIYQLSVESQKPMHAMGLVLLDIPNTSRKALVARIKLFAHSGATGYQVYIYEPENIGEFLKNIHI